MILTLCLVVLNELQCRMALHTAAAVADGDFFGSLAAATTGR